MRTKTDIEPSQQLCQSCGICCDGLLFESASVDADGPGKSWPAELIKTVTVDGNLPQPCQAYQGSNCSIYSARPAACQNYQCNLLGQLNAGEVSLTDAQESVRQTRRFWQAFHSALAEVMTVKQRASLTVMFENFRLRFKDEFNNPEFIKSRKKVFLTHARLAFALRNGFFDPEEDQPASTQVVPDKFSQ